MCMNGCYDLEWGLQSHIYKALISYWPIIIK